MRRHERTSRVIMDFAAAAHMFTVFVLLYCLDSAAHAIAPLRS